MQRRNVQDSENVYDDRVGRMVRWWWREGAREGYHAMAIFGATVRSLSSLSLFFWNAACLQSSSLLQL